MADIQNPPFTDDPDLDAWSTEVTNQLNDGGLGTSTEMDEEGRTIFDGITLPYPERYLGAFYATSAERNGPRTAFSPFIWSLDPSFVDLYQGVRNTASSEFSQVAADYLYRRLDLGFPDLVGTPPIVTQASELPANPEIGNRMFVSMGFTTTLDVLSGITQLLQAGGDPVLLADYSDGTGGTTTGTGAVFADIGSALDNIQWNAGSDRENNSVAYSTLVTDGRSIIVRQDINAVWRVWGAAVDSTPNGNQLRIRVEANAALQIDANPGWQVGFGTVTQENVPFLTGWYYWDGIEWVRPKAYYRLIGGKDIEWMFANEQPTGFLGNNTDEQIETEMLPMSNIDLFNVTTGDGAQGPAGASAYQLALQNGFIGTLEEWLASLEGDDGTSGESVRIDIAYFATLDGMDGVYPTGMVSDGSYNVAVRGTREFLGTRQVLWTAATTEPAISTTASDYDIVSFIGEDGAAGISTYQASIYRRVAADQPDPTAPDGTMSSYNFGTETLTIGDANWSRDIPAGDDPIWCSAGLFSAQGTTATDTGTTWSTPVLTAQNGVDGLNGISVYQAKIFRRSAGDLTDRPTGGSFNFGTELLTPPSLWFTSVPEGTDPLWSSTGQFATRGDTSTDITTTWSIPEIEARDGVPGDRSQTIYLYDTAITAPTAPTTGTGFDADSGEAEDSGTWTTTVPTIGTGEVIWIAQLTIRQPMSTGEWTNDGASWTVRQASGFNGMNGGVGPAGSDAPRFAEIILYANPAIDPDDSTLDTTAPQATITWSSGAISNITSGWSLSPPTQVATSNLVTFSSVVVFIDTEAPFTTTRATGTAPVQSTNFSGLVTFTGGDFAVDGATVTNIDGGNIETDTVTANQLVQGSASTVNAGESTATQNGRSGSISLSLDLSSFVTDLDNDYIVFARVNFSLTGITSSTRSTIGGSDNATVSVSYNNEVLSSTVLPIGNAGVRDGFIADGIGVSTTLIVDPSVTETIVFNGSTFSSEFSGTGTLRLSYEVGVIIR